MEILSTQNARIKHWAKYHDKKTRDTDQRFLVEGEHLVQEALSKQRLETLLVLQGVTLPFAFSGECIEVSEAVMSKLSQTKSQVPCIGVVRMEATPPQKLQRVVLLDGVQDPGNMGTILRSALAFGYDKIYISNECVDIYNDKVVRSTQGALFHIAIERCDLMEAVWMLKENGFTVYATDLQAAKRLQDTQTPEKLALVFGNEGQGVSQEVIQAANQNIIVEMATFESLNVAVAAGICMHHYYVQK
ncbi:MAG: TrmH family RNA methyltransferase [Erysipelotrichaceae bacterium]